MMTDSLRLYTYQELAESWKLSPRTIRRWIAQDEAQGHRVPRRRRRIGGRASVMVLRAAVAETLLRRHEPTLFP